MITKRILRMLVSSDASDSSTDGHRVERFPGGRITSSPWEGWWHEEPQAEGREGQSGGPAS
jgi:hypothetical protein